jgi:trafficking protein particle complex subunit 2
MYSYLKTVERYGTMAVSAYVTPGHIRFMLLHNNKNEESIRLFFAEAHELYLKVRGGTPQLIHLVPRSPLTHSTLIQMQLNAFYEINSPITSKAFHERVAALAVKRL